MRGVAVRPVPNGAQQGLAAQVRRLQREVDWLRRELALREGPQAVHHRVSGVPGVAAEGGGAGAGAASGAAGAEPGGSEPGPKPLQPAPEHSSAQGVVLLQQQRAQAGGDGPEAGAAALEPLGRFAAGASSTGRQAPAVVTGAALAHHAAGAPGEASQEQAHAVVAKAVPAASMAQPATPVSSFAGSAAAHHPMPGPGLPPHSGMHTGLGSVQLVGELMGGGSDDPLIAGIGLAPADARPPPEVPQTLRFRRHPAPRAAGTAAAHVLTHKAARSAWATPAAAAASPAQAHDGVAGLPGRVASRGPLLQQPAVPEASSAEALLSSSWQERMQAGHATIPQSQEWQRVVPGHGSNAAALDRDTAFEAFQQASMRKDDIARDMRIRDCL